NQHRRRPQSLRLHRRLPRRLQLSGRHVGHRLRRRRFRDQQRGPEFRGWPGALPRQRQGQLDFANPGALARGPAWAARLQRLGLSGWGWFGDKTLLYVTGGGAWAKIDASEFLIGANTATGHQESNTRSGWTVGGGLEYALGYGWSVKGEYLYVKFDDYTTFTTPPFGGAGLNIAPRNVKLYDNIFRSAMNYKFC